MLSPRRQQSRRMASTTEGGININATALLHQARNHRLNQYRHMIRHP